MSFKFRESLVKKHTWTVFTCVNLLMNNQMICIFEFLGTKHEWIWPLISLNTFMIYQIKWLYEFLVTKLILIWLVICMNLHMAACENKLNILISCHKLCMYIAWILLSISQGLLVTKAVVTNITFPYLYSLKNFTMFSDSLVTICDQKFSVRQSEPPWADSHK